MLHSIHVPCSNNVPYSIHVPYSISAIAQGCVEDRNPIEVLASTIVDFMSDHEELGPRSFASLVIYVELNTT
jgi:hypothetical protein